MTARQSLGRGFDALIPTDIDQGMLKEDKNRIQNLLITDIYPNPRQPRREFDQSSLGELANSIRTHGVMQPIIVVQAKKGYRIVAGERRWRAARDAQLENIPAIVRSLEELEEIELSLIENIQRVDLSPLEQALAVYRLQQQFNLTLDQIAEKLGKATSTVSNLGRLLQLPTEAREALREGKISEGHARAILSLKGYEVKQDELLSSILNNNWSVRQAEEFVKVFKVSSKGNPKGDFSQLAEGISAKLGSQVMIKSKKRGGQIIIPFKNDDELKDISQKLTG
jgi:ParB family transcriptional regulator, chromosome partitioning protein